MLTDILVGAEAETLPFHSEGHCVFCHYIVAVDLHPNRHSWRISGNRLADEEVVRFVISL